MGCFENCSEGTNNNGNKTLDTHVRVMYYLYMDAPKTLQEAIIYFSDPQRAFDSAVHFRWPGGDVTCPRCGKAKHSFIKTRRIWFCYECKKQFTVKVGTIFEDSPLGLDKWMVALWMLANCKNGISSYELGKALGIRQNSAWFMLHRIREAMKDKSKGKLGGGSGGAVESDETYVGGTPSKMHKSRRLKLQQIRGEQRRGDVYLGKTAVIGMLDRVTREVRTQVIPNVRRETLQNAILDNVERGSKLYTDSAVTYENLSECFVHDVINHSREYVKGQVHTQGIENFWSLLKRSLRGTYVAVEPFHLDRYLDEQVFRYSNRATRDNPLNDSDRFVFLMSKVAGKRLTYAKLTGKDTDSLHHETTGTGEAQVPF
ncbi:MAG TPA: IS1595 family transposase [Terriglobales bacterium]|nr:IS1595 family transposase [Terriglobales bacterium]